jgi:hypothetical protein
MVEPAIAITASNIATLRPLFKNSLFFAKKRFDPMDDDDRPSTESSYNLKSRNSISAALYSPEFAEMLGLSRVGVTTEISAGGGKDEREYFRDRFKLARKTSKERPDSQLILHDISPLPSPHPLDWSSGIITTTTVTIDDK